MLNVIIWEKFVFMETKLNHVEWYCRGNNSVLSVIPDTVEIKDLEITASSIFSDIDVTVGSLDVETCHRTDLSAKNKSKIIIVRLFNRT